MKQKITDFYLSKGLTPEKISKIGRRPEPSQNKILEAMIFIYREINRGVEISDINIGRRVKGAAITKDCKDYIKEYYTIKEIEMDRAVEKYKTKSKRWAMGFWSYFALSNFIAIAFYLITQKGFILWP